MLDKKSPVLFLVRGALIGLLSRNLFLFKEDYFLDGNP